MFAFFRGFIVLLFLTLLVFVVNFCQLLSVVAIPFSRNLFDRFNMGIKQFYCGTLARGALLCGNRLDIIGEAPRIENAILMANHQAYLDIPVLWMWLVETPIIGWMKWFVKDEFKYVPGLGWGLKFVRALFVKRTWSKDSESIKNTFQGILEANLPYWVTIFPEGTRMKRSKYELAVANSKRKGTHLFQRVLFPRPKGVWSSIQGLKSNLNAVYDVTIAFNSTPPSVFQFYCNGNYTVKILVKRYGISEIPTIERDFNQWMQERFMEKDAWLAKNSGWTFEFAIK